MTEHFDGDLFPWEDEPAPARQRPADAEAGTELSTPPADAEPQAASPIEAESRAAARSLEAEPQPAARPLDAESQAAASSLEPAPDEEPERTSGGDGTQAPQAGPGEPQTTAAQPDWTESDGARSPRDSPDQEAAADQDAPDQDPARVQGPGSRAAAGQLPAAAPATRTDAPTRPLVRKEYYSISEVSDLVGLPAHVLRYWESQFSVLNPSKNRSGNRVYQRKEIKLILLVKQLLHEEKYTVEGAKQKLDQLRRGGGIGDATQHALDEQMVRVLREDLLALSELLRVEGE